MAGEAPHNSSVEVLRKMQRAEEAHRHRLAALLQERQRIMSQEIIMRKGYAAAGVPPPVQPAASPEDRTRAREMVLAGLEGEVEATSAFLEALRDGKPLAEAQQAGAVVLKEQRALDEQLHQADHSSTANRERRPPAQPPWLLKASLLRTEAPTPSPQPSHPATHQLPGKQRKGALSTANHTSTHASPAPGTPDSSYTFPNVRDTSRVPIRRPTNKDALDVGPAPAAPPGSEWAVDEPPPPKYVEELKQQLQQLQQAMLGPGMGGFPMAPAFQLQQALLGQQLLGLQVQQQQQQQQQQATAPAPAPGSRLPPGLEGDMEMQRLHQHHVREMAKLQFEIDRVRSHAELESLRANLNDLRRAVTGAAPGPAQQEVMRQLLEPAIGFRVSTAAEQAAAEAAQPAAEAGEPQQEGEAGGAAEGEEAQQEGAGDAAVLIGEEEREAAVGEALMALARGSEVKTQVLQITITKAGPFQMRGTYRFAAVLYEGLQPLAAGADAVLRCSSQTVRLKSPNDPASGGGVLHVEDTLTLWGVPITATTTVVFEVYCAKQGVAGMPTRESLIAWAAFEVTSQGRVVRGTKSTPVYHLPLVLSARRKFSFHCAMIDFSLLARPAAPGESYTEAVAASRRGGGPRPSLSGAPTEHEDIPGVPSRAWLRVTRGTPPANLYTPGDGLVVFVDGARFLPGSCTISKVLVAVMGPNGQPLRDGASSVCRPDANALNPSYALQLQMGGVGEHLDNPMATLVLQVQAVERHSGEVRVAGFGVLELFLDASDNRQPLSANVREYLINQGAFQIPLHLYPPPRSAPVSGKCMDAVPRMPCATLLLRILSADAAKLERRRPLPLYENRVYDTARSLPTATEQRMYPRYLARKVFSVRDAARIAATNADPSASSSTPLRRSPANSLSPSAAAAQLPPAPTAGGLFARFRSSAAKPAPSPQHAPCSSRKLQPAAPAAMQAAADSLPSSDAELLNWMQERFGSASGQLPPLLNLNLASEYFPDLGFFVAVDGAQRIPRGLPTAALISITPPGSFYQDSPLPDDVLLTLDYELEAPLSAPQWLDGYQTFASVPYDPSLCLIIDVRFVVPATSTTAPVGWACLPVFEPSGSFVASGHYHLPLFQGLPSRYIMAEIARSGNPDRALREQLASGNLKFTLDSSSVYVRLLDHAREGQLDAPYWAGAPPPRVPAYAQALAGTMPKPLKSKTYNQLRPKDITAPEWVDDINDTILRMTGLDTQFEVEGGGPAAPPAASPHAPTAQLPTPSQPPPTTSRQQPGSAVARGSTAKQPTAAASTPTQPHPQLQPLQAPPQSAGVRLATAGSKPYTPALQGVVEQGYDEVGQPPGTGSGVQEAWDSGVPLREPARTPPAAT